MNKKNIILLLLLSMGIMLSDGFAASQRPRTFCESAELVTGVLRGPAVMAAHIAKLKTSPTQARLFKMFANSIRLANQLLSIKNKPNDAHHYDICWSAHDIAMTLCDCLVLFEQRNQTAYNEDDDIPFDDDDNAPEMAKHKPQDEKPALNLNTGTAFIYTTILPAIEGFTATYSACLNTHGELSDVKNKRTALKTITSLSRCLSGVLGVSKDSSLRTVYLYALVANIAAALYEISHLTEAPPVEECAICCDNPATRVVCANGHHMCETCYTCLRQTSSQKATCPFCRGTLL